MTSVLVFAIIAALVIIGLALSRAGSVNVPGSHIRSFALTYLTLIVVVAVSLSLAWNTGLDEVGLFTLGFGVWFLLFTALRVWWFWNHPLSIWWRELLSDRGARAFFLAVGMFLSIIGVIDIRQGVQDVESCRRLYAQARDAHERMRALYYVPRKDRSSILDPIGVRSSSLSCELYRERGAF